MFIIAFSSPLLDIGLARRKIHTLATRVGSFGQFVQSGLMQVA